MPSEITNCAIVTRDGESIVRGTPDDIHLDGYLIVAVEKMEEASPAHIKDWCEIIRELQATPQDSGELQWPFNKPPEGGPMPD